ncbi:MULTISPECIES: hypothetical protein [Gordonia]|uniref:hypothetical protein n=1 Tax=Gordonia TaxID=2053 RepID=UPI0032636261
MRAAEAEQIIDGLGPLSRRDSDSTARLLLRAYYGPTADETIADQTTAGETTAHGTTTGKTAATGTFWSVVDCGRESPRLGALLGRHRRTAVEQLARLLSACGYPTMPPGLAASVMDGGIVTATVEGVSPATEAAVSELAAVLHMADPPRMTDFQ